MKLVLSQLYFHSRTMLTMSGSSRAREFGSPSWKTDAHCRPRTTSYPAPSSSTAFSAVVSGVVPPKETITVAVCG